MTTFNFPVKPRRDWVDPDEVMRRDMFDALASMRRRLAGMVGQTESARRHREGAPGTPRATSSRTYGRQYTYQYDPYED